MKTIWAMLAVTTSCFASAGAEERINLEGRIQARGATFPVTSRVEMRFGMERLSTEIGADRTEFRAAGVTLIRRIGDSPLGVGVGLRLISGRVHAAHFEDAPSNFALTAPFAGLSFRKSRFGSFEIEGTAGVALTRMRDGDPFDDHQGDDAARPVAILSLRAKF